MPKKSSEICEACRLMAAKISRAAEMQAWMTGNPPQFEAGLNQCRSLRIRKYRKLSEKTPA